MTADAHASGGGPLKLNRSGVTQSANRRGGLGSGLSQNAKYTDRPYLSYPVG